MNSIGAEVTIDGAAAPSVGRIDQYELQRELGGGGFGTVFLAKDTAAGVEVAVKGLPPLVRNNYEELERVRRNFALVSILHHPNIASALVLHPARQASYANRSVAERFRVFEGDLMFVMEYAPGVTLSQWRRQFPDGKVPLELALTIVRQLSSALDYAHQRQIIHRDVKPANVMIETKGESEPIARLLDFGLAAEVRLSMGRVSQQVTDKSGTRPYMAPEQWQGTEQGAASDQYSLAVLFYELIVGEVPFASVFETGDPAIMAHAVGNSTPTIPNALPKNIRRALSRALAKRKEERFGSCTEFAEALAKEPSHLGLIAAIVATLVAGGASVFWGGNTANETRPLPLPAPTITNAPPKEIAKSKPAVVTAEPRSVAKPKPAMRKAIPAIATPKQAAIHAEQPIPVVTNAPRWPVTKTGKGILVESPQKVSMSFARFTISGKPLWVATTETTQAQWGVLVDENPSHLKHRDCPVSSVTLSNCEQFCQRMTDKVEGWRFRLPTSSEWRSICSSEGNHDFSWGNEYCDQNGSNYANYRLSESSLAGKPKPVKSYLANVNGVYDLHGNVAEWCSDGKICGGGYSDLASDCTIEGSVMEFQDANLRSRNVGFRIVAERISANGSSVNED